MRRAWVLGVAIVSAAGLAGCGGSAANHKASEKLAAVTPVPTTTPQPAAGGGDAVVQRNGVDRPRLSGLGVLRLSGRSTDVREPPRRRTGDRPAVHRDPDRWSGLRSLYVAVHSGLVPAHVALALELSTDAIAAREFAMNIGVGPHSHLSVLDSGTEGTSEGAPVQVFLAKVADDVDHVQLAIGSGHDVASPVQGLVALALTGSQSAGTVTAYDASGKVLQQIQVPAPADPIHRRVPGAAHEAADARGAARRPAGCRRAGTRRLPERVHARARPAATSTTGWRRCRTALSCTTRWTRSARTSRRPSTRSR